MRNTKYMAEFLSLGFLSSDTPLFNLLSGMVYCRRIRLRFMSPQVQVLTYKYFFSWEIEIGLYNTCLILNLTCTYCPSPPGKGVSRHKVSVGELAFRYLGN